MTQAIHARILSVMFLFLLVANSAGQELKFYSPTGSTSQNSITTAIHQDEKGFLWFGTRYGANRYNGLEFKSFRTERGNIEGLLSNTISCFLSDQEGNIWMGTLGGGIAVYDIDLQTFNPLYRTILESLNHSHINDIFLDSNGNIWIGTSNGGIKLLEKGTNHLKHYFSSGQGQNGVPSNHITGIDEDQQGNIIFSTWGGGLCFFNTNKGIFKVYNHENTPVISADNTIRHLGKGRQQDVYWLGTHQGVLKLELDESGEPVFSKIDFNNPTINELFENVVVLCVLEDSQSRLWVGTENKGLILFDLENKSATKFQYDPKDRYNIKSNSIWSLYEDRHGTIWIGTYKNGIKKVDPWEQKFQYISASSDSKFNVSYGLTSSFAEDDKGNLWVGTDGGGLNYITRDAEYNIQSIQHPPFSGIDSDVIVSLLNDKRGRLWVGTWGKGLYTKEKNESEFNPIIYETKKSEGSSTNDIMYLFEAPSDHIWICQYRAGLNLYVPEEDKFYHYEPSVNSNSISSRNILSIVEDKDGIIWVGSDDLGIDRFRLNEKKEIIDLKNFSFSKNDLPNFSENAVNYLYIDSRNILWVGTEGGGLKKYDSNNETFESISEEDGLPSNVIYGMQDDGEKLWVSTNSGLVSIAFDNSEIQTYNKSDGLQSNEFSRSSCYKTKDGIFLFGGTNGFNFFDPKNISFNSVIPDVFITKVTLRRNDNNIELQKEINQQLVLGQVELKADQNDLDFEFAALNYTQSVKNTFSYILENYDREWKNVQNTSIASYTNIPPGKYVFKIKASNNDDVWNPEPAVVNIEILPPWHKSDLAFAYYLLSFLCILMAIYFIVVYRERLRNQLKMEQMERTKMEELNAIKSRFFANISHEFKTPLTLIISPLKAIQKKLEKIENKNQINLMLRNAERLLTLINQILALSKLQSGTEKLKASKFDIVEFARIITDNFKNYAEEQFITFDVNLPDHPIDLYFEKDKMEKVLINLISNAFKYTSEFGRINFTLTQEEKRIKIAVYDTGIGISKDQLELIFERFYRADNYGKSTGTGIGLSLTKQLVELHKGEINVQSTEGQGTAFEVFMPLGKTHLDETQIQEQISYHNLSEDSKIELKDFNVKTRLEEIPPEATDNNVPVVLIAEDNPDMRAFTRTYLQTNYQIIEAENGRQAYELAKRHIPDIVITDWMMPEMTGFELAKKLRQDEKTSHASILMLTVKSSEESTVAGFSAGVDYYITKPFNPKLLDLRIQNILKTRKKYKAQILKRSIELEELPQDVSISSKDEEFLNKILAIIDENIGNPGLNIDYICKKIGFSKSQLYRKMKGLVGQSVNEFTRSIRLKRAAGLLLNGDMTISEITYKVGFNDLQYFRTCFKNQYNMTPSEYIQKVKKGVK